MLNEREKPRSRIKTLLIELQREGKTIYKPILVNETAHNDITHFIIKETGRLKKRFKELRAMPTKRSKRESRDIRESRKKIINKEQLVEKLSVLKGERLQPIRLISKRNRIERFELVSFAQEEQERWWTYLKQKGQMNKIAEIAQVYSEGPELLFKLFSIRYKMKYGSSKEAAQAEEDFDILRQRTSKTPEKHDTLLVPLYKMISEDFGN